MEINLLVILVVSYFMGSIPFSYILGKVVKGIDLRHHGSGNVGATNALRVLGWKIGIIAMILDILKGYGAVILALVLLPETNLAHITGGLFAIFGHIFTVFLGFKGGKGVATSAGVFAALIPVTFVIGLSCFVLITAISRYVSAGSIMAAVILVISQSFFTFRNGVHNPEYLILVIIAAIFIIVKHKANIKRLLNGTESKISFRHKT